MRAPNPIFTKFSRGVIAIFGILVASGCSVQGTNSTVDQGFSPGVDLKGSAFVRSYAFTPATAMQYTYNSGSIDLNLSYAELTPINLIDQDNSAAGFGGATLTGVTWDATNLEVRLSPSATSTGTAAHSGTLTSRAMDGLSASQTWANLVWTSTLPFYKSLPDGGSSETTANYSSLYSGSLMTGIQAVWHLDEPVGTSGAGSIKDTSGVATPNNGTPAGSPTFGAAGRLGTGMNANGASVTIPTVNEPGDFTFSGWAYLTRAGGATNADVLMGNSGTGATLNFYVGYFRMWTGSVDVIISSVPTSLNTWEHYVITRTGSALTMYINGVQVATGSYSGNYAFTGISSLGTTAGTLDEFALWGRALQPQEILQVYRRGANRLKYQIRTCSESSCTAGSPTFVGADGTSASYFSEIYNSVTNIFGNTIQTSVPSMLFSNFVGLTVPNKRYFQYQVVLESDDASTACNYGSGATYCSPELKSVSSGPSHYDNSAVTLTTNVGTNYKSLTSFSESLGPSGCSSGIVYNLSRDGSNWVYWNGASWSAADGTALKANPATTLSSHISAFSTGLGTGQVYIKAFLQSSGTSTCQLSNVSVGGTQ